MELICTCIRILLQMAQKGGDLKDKYVWSNAEHTEKMTSKTEKQLERYSRAEINSHVKIIHQDGVGESRNQEAQRGKRGDDGKPGVDAKDHGEDGQDGSNGTEGGGVTPGATALNGTSQLNLYGMI